MESGVPQGTVLGPALFLLYINDLPDTLKSHVRLFADDAVIYRSVESPQDCVELQSDIDSLSSWENDWKMDFNITKCSVVSIHRKRSPIVHQYLLHQTPLKHIDHTSYLGLTLTSNLSWNKHIDSISSKANKTLGFIKRNLKHAPKPTKSTAYTVLVRPKLEYSSTVWDPHTRINIDKIERVQRRAARFVSNDYSSYSSVTSMLNTLKWPTLQTRRSNAKLNFMYKIVHALVAIPHTYLPPPLTSSSRRTHSLSFQRISTRTQYYAHSFFPSTVILWNNLPPHIPPSASLEIFSKRLH